ncbi:50S ribosomal protein L29 [Candidatus Woesearchaeota archaeon]|nr:50S ribosomal protein L29 [Candidatus Woesearchaeota archaeon]MBW2978545.1 50S ribosomal protein L29 [Candidatus Woesearchaeota archaeon]
MKIKELKSMPVSELKEKLVQLKLELAKERAQIATGTVPKSPGKVKVARKTIARINTILAMEDKKA